MYFIYKYTQTYNLFKKKIENFCLLFQKIFALKVIMHMCMKVKDRVKLFNLFVFFIETFHDLA